MKQKHQKSEIQADLKYWFGLSKFSCLAGDYFDKTQQGIHAFVLAGYQWGKIDMTFYRNAEEEGTGAKKPHSCFTERSAPSSSQTPFSWIWMMLNPWEEGCHVKHNCNTGRFLQTDPRASLDNTASSTGDSVSLHLAPHFFASFSHFCDWLIKNCGRVPNAESSLFLLKLQSFIRHSPNCFPWQTVYFSKSRSQT